MESLTDRYVAQVLRGVPAAQRRDVERELRASIADAVQAQAEQSVEAQESVLNQLGDPAKLAASLADRPQYLIGPGLYWEYRRVLRTLLLIVPAAVALTVSAVQAFTATPPLDVLLSGLGLLVTVAVQVVFWTTLGFAIAEYTGNDHLPDRRRWTVADLPRQADRGVTLGDTVGTVLGLLIGIAAIIWQHFGSRVSPTQNIPVLDPALWSFWLPALLVLMSAAAVLQLLAYARGRWTPVLAALRVIGDLVFGAVGIVGLMTQQVLNPAFFEALGQAAWAQPGSPLTQGIAWVIGVVVVVDVFEVVRKVRM